MKDKEPDGTKKEDAEKSAPTRLRRRRAARKKAEKKAKASRRINKKR